MAWTNIFALAEWDVYVQFLGVTGAPGPDSRDNLVPIAELDPAVATATVEDGVITITTEDVSGDVGTLLRVVAFPSGVAPDEAPFRVTATQDGSPMMVPLAGAAIQSIESVDSVGASIYDATVGAVDDLLSGEEPNPVTEKEATGPCPSGQGVGFSYYTDGF